jgi:hypothetical protein
MQIISEIKFKYYVFKLQKNTLKKEKIERKRGLFFRSKVKHFLHHFDKKIGNKKQNNQLKK